MNERIEEQPYDDRHTVPPVTIPVADFVRRNPVIDGEHIGNDHQEPDFFRPVHNDAGEHIGEEINHPHARRPEFPGMPSRIPGETLLRPHDAQNGFPSFGTGLSWQASVQSPRIDDLASIDWDSMKGMPNVELHTLFAHLMVTAESIRSEMRVRGMRVDL